MSYLIIAPNSVLSLNYAKDLCLKKNINSLDTTIITKKDESKSIGVKDIAELMQKIYLKPLRGKSKAIILSDSHLLTIEAQNALLKVLEEPPLNTIIFLTSNSKEAFLPTILSRCRIIDISGKFEPKEIDEENFTHFRVLKKLDPKNALEIAEKSAKDKDQAVIYISNLIRAGQKILLEEVQNNNPGQYVSAKVLSLLQITYKNLSTTNINTRLELENLLLSISTD